MTLPSTEFYMILDNNLLPEEHRQVWDQARSHADEIYQMDEIYPVGAREVPIRTLNGITIT